jgi:hypothetical protein
LFYILKKSLKNVPAEVSPTTGVLGRSSIVKYTRIAYYTGSVQERVREEYPALGDGS